MSAGDRDTLAAELAAHQWHQPEGYESIWDQSAHANHEYYYRCAICTNDLDALADVLLASDWLREQRTEAWDEGATHVDREWQHSEYNNDDSTPGYEYWDTDVSTNPYRRTTEDH